MSASQASIPGCPASVEWGHIKVPKPKTLPILPQPIKNFTLDVNKLQTTRFADIIKKSILDDDFLKLVNNTQERISFFGTRYLTIPILKGKRRINGSVHIDALAAQVISLVQKKQFEYTPEERRIGAIISRKIDLLYEANDKRLEKVNFLTKVFNFLRQVPYFCFYLTNNPFRAYPLRDRYWSDEMMDCSMQGMGFRNIFDLYTKKQYENAFGKSPSKYSYQELYRSGFEGHCDNFWSSPLEYE